MNNSLNPKEAAAFLKKRVLGNVVLVVAVLLGLFAGEYTKNLAPLKELLGREGAMLVGPILVAIVGGLYIRSECRCPRCGKPEMNARAKICRSCSVSFG